jgi:hypothetical protein
MNWVEELWGTRYRQTTALKYFSDPLLSTHMQTSEMPKQFCEVDTRMLFPSEQAFMLEV